MGFEPTRFRIKGPLGMRFGFGVAIVPIIVG